MPIDREETTEEEIDDFYRKIGRNVKRIRESRGLTQLQLSQILGHRSVSLVSLAEIYHERRHFNLEHLLRISRALDVDICDFFEGISKRVENDSIQK